MVSLKKPLPGPPRRVDPPPRVEVGASGRGGPAVPKQPLQKPPCEMDELVEQLIEQVIKSVNIGQSLT